jgi:tRNA(Ser,Leu) C12 N-acetylase TAN1
MKDWNILVTTSSGEERDLLPALRRLGEFTRSEFKGILIGRVEDTSQFLQAVQLAGEAGAAWRRHLLRVLPVERMFSFTPQTLEEQLREAVIPFVQRMMSGTFHVRLERRGYKGKIVSPEVEQRLGDYVMEVAKQQNKILSVSFHDSDYVIAVETVGNQCGVTLITRRLQEQYPFVKIR